MPNDFVDLGKTLRNHQKKIIQWMATEWTRVKFPDKHRIYIYIHKCCIQIIYMHTFYYHFLIQCGSGCVFQHLCLRFPKLVWGWHSLVIVVQVNMFLARFYANTYVKHHETYYRLYHRLGQRKTYTGWWFQPIWKILVKLETFPK